MNNIKQKNIDNLTRREHFEIMNAQILKYLVNPHTGSSCISANIPIKYLPHFKAVTKSKKAKNVRYRYRGCSKPGYQRPQSFCHLVGADTFSLYYR